MSTKEQKKDLPNWAYSYPYEGTRGADDPKYVRKRKGFLRRLSEEILSSKPR